jgi:epoxyqueuosine reductase
MFAFLSRFFEKNRIDCFAPISLADCSVVRSYLLERAGIADGTAILVAIPYFTSACADEGRNLSAYAVSRDYHGFFAALFDELLPQLRERFPAHKFVGFADHSPIAEVEAAARAGLGVIGQNHLLITERYSSYVFLGEIVTDAKIDCTVGEIRTCEGCGLCQRACPMDEIGTCLSALTQKKGALTADEQATILRYGSVWGCDICQAVCSHTKRAIESGTVYSPIAYFEEEPIAHLTSEILDAMSDEDFQKRAYAWRGRETIARNLKL